MARSILVGMLAIAATFTIAVGTAAAQGGNYAFAGGTDDQQAQVKAALDASAFPWGVVPGPVQIHIAPGLASAATPGNIYLDTALVDQGAFAWSIVQHEYAHQVDFLLLDEATRTALLPALGGRAWCWDSPGFRHAQYGCERFASTLVWSYWQSDDNSLKPTSAADESAAASPRVFKALLGRILTAPAGAASGLIAAYVSAQGGKNVVGRAPAARPAAIAQAAAVGSR